MESLDSLQIKELETAIFEDGLSLLGATALEDLLQDDVFECIKEFRAAKIKVWMLTGDKGETAHNIAISCGLIDQEKHRLF